MGAVMTKVNPLSGRSADLHEYEMSDLSVEEQLAGGASVDDLIKAGVLYDDCDQDEDWMFTPRTTKEEIAALREKAIQNSRLTKEEERADMDAFFAAYDALT